MTRFLKNWQETLNKPPGTLVYVPRWPQEEVKIRVINFNDEILEDFEVESVEECLPYLEVKETITWINIEGLTDSNVIQQIGKSFGIHALWLEDVLNTDHRPKLEELDDLIFCIIKAVDYGKRKPERVTFEQLSLFLSEGLVISFQEFAGDVFQPVLERLKKKRGRIRQAKTDYLFYALIDSVVDEYFVALEKLGHEIEGLETKINASFENDLFMEISRLKTELIFLKKFSSPIKDVLAQCLNTEKSEIAPGTKKYFKDAYDHIMQVNDTVRSYFEMIEAAKDTFRAVQANKMNEVMKVLTIFSSFFIPLTFIAGVYGMNFKSIPELEWQFGYLFFWGLIGTAAVILMLFFRKKKWL